MKAVALLSSGIDSPVAIYLMLRRGVEITPIHFRQDSIKEEKASEIVEILKRYGKLSDPIIVNFSEEHVPAFEKLRELGKIKYTCVLCKWLMLRKACRIGHEIGASAIITGDSLGQVASQTLDNLMVVSTASDLPILRPLIGLDKEEIVRIAKEIGTFEISSKERAPMSVYAQIPGCPCLFGEFQKILQDLI